MTRMQTRARLAKAFRDGGLAVALCVGSLVAGLGADALAKAAAVSIGAQKPAPKVAMPGGDHLMYIGTYAGDIQIFDETSETMVGDIKLKTGIPRSLTLSQSRKKFYVLDSTLEKIEIVDIPTRASLSTFTLSEGNKKVRIRGFQVDPLERFLILLTRSATKQIDRWEIGDITIQLYDLAQNKVTRTIPWPRGEEREFINIRFSPDGKLLYFFGDDVLILETTNFTEVDTWALSRPLEPGLGRVNFGSVDDFNEDPGFFTGLFTIQDPLHGRRIMGLGRVNLVAKSIDFTPIGPAEGVSFAMTQGSQARLRPDAADRPLRVLGVRRRAAPAVEPHAVRGPAAHGAARVVERPAAVCLSGRRDHRRLRCRDVQEAAHHRDERRSDDEPVHTAAYVIVPMDRRAFAYLVPYWRRLVLVLAISLISTATTLVIPYLSKDLIDKALIGRDLDALRRIVGWFIALGVFGFILNVTSGLRYTRVSAEILFDMRLSLYAHLQRLSPRYYARTRLGDIVSRLNNDISEIQRVAAEAALAWVGNVLFLAGSLVMMIWLDWRLALIALAPLPISLIALAFYRRRLESRVAELRQKSADIGSFLIETLQATSLDRRLERAAT